MKLSFVKVVLLGQLILGILVLFFLSKVVFPYTTDSFIYITTAEHISHFQGMLSANFFVEGPTGDVLPLLIDPPGFPLLIALLKGIGVDAYRAALFIPAACFLSLPFLFFFIFRRLMPERLSLITAFVSAFMFVVIKSSLIAWSDIPFLCFSLLSILCVFRILESQLNAHWLFILYSGALIGYAFLIRYVAASLMASIGFSFLAGLLLGLIPKKNAFKAVLLYGAGIALVVFPYIIRNVLVFGSIQPFHNPPSSLGLVAHIQEYFTFLSEVLLIEPFWGGGVLAFISLVVLGFLFYAKTWMNKDSKSFLAALFLVNYFLFYSAFLVFCRAHNYTMGINERYLMPIAWITAAMLIFCIHAVLCRGNSGAKRRSLPWVIAFLLLAFVFLQGFGALKFYFEQKRIKFLSAKIAGHLPVLDKIPGDTVIVSNVADLTYYLTRRNVRMLGAYSPEGLFETLGHRRKYAVWVVKDGRFISPFWSYLPAWENPAGYQYQKIFSDWDVDLFVLKEREVLR